MYTLYFNNTFLFLCPRRLGPVLGLSILKIEKREYKDKRLEPVWFCVVLFQANAHLIWGCRWSEGTSYNTALLQIA